MRYDTGWEAIIHPGDGDSFFRRPPRARRFIGAFRNEARPFRPANAWWLSEMCRLIYRRGPEEIGEQAPERSRADFLAAAGFREHGFFFRPSVQCGIFSTPPGAKNGFAALVFRGTKGLETWLSNLNTLQVRWPRGGMVHGGFKKEFFRVWPEVSEAMADIDLPFFYTGHSLGGALALLAASMRPPRAVYTFGAPRAGDSVFAAGLAEVPVYRIANPRDIVPAVPPSRIPFDFRHVGEPILLTAPEVATEAEPSEETEATAAPESMGAFAAVKSAFSTRRILPGPPEFLSDHAPVNYTVHLERLLHASPGQSAETRKPIRPVLRRTGPRPPTVPI
jgi:triacylglycerol lipase